MIVNDVGRPRNHALILRLSHHAAHSPQETNAKQDTTTTYQSRDTLLAYHQKGLRASPLSGALDPRLFW